MTIPSEPVPSRARARHRARRSPLRRAVFGLLVVLVTVAGLGIAFGTEQVDGVAEDVGRVGDAFPAEGARPPEATPDALTFLVVGVDPSDRDTGEARAEAALVVRLSGDRQHLQAVTLSPDTWVEDEDRTLEDAFAAEGPQGVVAAVEDLSGVRLDHYAELDFAGLAGITDSLGGITVDVPAPYRNRGHEFAAGPQRLDGPRAVAYVRDADPAARAGAPERYQRVLQGLFDRVQELGAFSGLGRLTDLLGSVTSALRVDDTLADEDLVATAWEFRGAGRPDVLVAPSAGGQAPDGRPVTVLDGERAGALWGYLREDTLAAHLGEFR